MLAKITKDTYDVAQPDKALSEGALGARLCKAIAQKGYCSLPSQVSTSDLAKARQNVKEVEMEKRFYRPAPELEFGLLGAEGSAYIAELGAPDKPGNSDGLTLQSLDAKMTDLATAFADCSEEMLGFKVAERTLSWLHRWQDAPEEDPEELTEDVASKWINCFARARIMCLMVLGPKGGSFELTPFDGESDTMEVVVDPGAMLLVRTDVLSINFLGRELEHIMASWFLQENLAGVRGAYNQGLEQSATHPAVQRLSEWAWQRMNIYKYELGEGKVDAFESSIPRGWQMAANRKLIRERAQIVIRGSSHKIPNTGTREAYLASIQSGCDMATNVPTTRWDHTPYYKPEPEIYERERLSTNVNHACFIEGADLFDNKFFNISPLEGRVMDPVQRNTLEANYQALNESGYTSKGEKDKTKLMQKYIGVYQGSNTGEYTIAPHEQAGGCAGSEGSPAIVSNRVSFALGLMGPSYTMQTDAASALSAIYEGAFDVYPTTFKDKPLVDAAACGGIYLMLTPFYWPLWNAWMDPLGRTCSFDQDSQGHIRGDSSGTVVLKRHGEMVDGKFVFDDGVNILGTLTGWATTNNGRTASIHAPNGHSLQVAVVDALRMAALSPLDVDGVACNANGIQLHDAVEVSSIAKVFRNGVGGDQEVLNLTATIADVGWGQEAHGMSGFLGMMMLTRHGFFSGNIHMKAINPYIDCEERAIQIPQDALSFRLRKTYAGVTAFGFTGSNVHIQMSNFVDETLHGTKTYSLDIEKKLSYWPGGGGKASVDETPMRGYTILGSWSSWEELEPMQEENSSLYTYKMTLGENRWESFQILLDGDRSRTLHPGFPRAGSNEAVIGPVSASEAEGSTWTIDGSQRWAQSLDDEEWKEVDDPDTGLPGDTYLIKLKVTGKWRTVVWEKQKSVPGKAVPRGHYYLVGDFNEWTLEEMHPEPEKPGVFSLDVCLLVRGGRFQIVRNKDLEQVFYPAAGDEAGPVEGPSEGAYTPEWNLRGKPGEVFRIEFSRQFEDGADTKEVSWEKVGYRDPAEEYVRKQKAQKQRAAEREAREAAEAAELERLMG
mmetsp:Transcript_44708/g.83384  ORF Transcript_44708/g.83384 Transcript_44708/m.83384 type:complete len:1060 (-) Transcript_44708:36-3215(-)